MASGDSKKSFQKALYLAIAFVIVLVVANSLIKIVSNPGNLLRPRMDGGNANLVELDTGETALIKKKISGFWHCDGVLSRQYPFLSVSDRFELKNNGIFWRVRRDVARLQSGDSVDFVTVMNGYMQPYYKSKTNPDSIMCQVHFIGLVMICGKDTCYAEHTRMSTDPKKSVIPDILRTKVEKGDVAADTVWDVFMNASSFFIEGRPYAAFDTAGSTLPSFFPKGSVKLIGKISVPECANTVSLESSVKQALLRDFAGLSVESRTQEGIAKTVDTYYRVMFVENLARRATSFRKGSFTLSFAVDKHGRVSDPKVLDAKPLNMRLNNDLKQEILTWVFPVCASQNSLVVATIPFVY